MSADIETAVRAALAVLERASDSWRNGEVGAEGPLHWPVVIQCAQRELHSALALVERLQERAAQLEAIARLNAETIRRMHAPANTQPMAKYPVRPEPCHR